MGKIIEPEKLQGKYVNLREVTVEDAEFILSLRTDDEKSKYLHKTDNDLQKQIEYIQNYFKRNDEVYFIIENKEHKSIGTHRIYNINPPTFTTGSWLMINEAAPNESFESIFLIMNYAFNVLGLKKNCFDIRKDNVNVIKFNKFLGAKIVREDDIDVYFEATKEDYRCLKGT